MITIEHANSLTFQILKHIENMFGSRMHSNFNGVEFTNKNQPELVCIDNFYTIHLTQLAIQSEEEAIFQIAHELIHLISPTDKKDISYLEEGLAIWFSLYELRSRNYEEYAKSLITHIRDNYPNYYTAYTLIKRISNIPTFIKSIRGENLCKKISLVNLEELSQISEDNNLSTELIRKFYT